MRFRNLTLAIISILLVRLVTPAQQAVATLDRNDRSITISRNPMRMDHHAIAAGSGVH